MAYFVREGPRLETILVLAKALCLRIARADQPRRTVDCECPSQILFESLVHAHLPSISKRTMAIEGFFEQCVSLGFLNCRGVLASSDHYTYPWLPWANDHQLDMLVLTGGHYSFVNTCRASFCRTKHFELPVGYANCSVYNHLKEI